MKLTQNSDCKIWQPLFLKLMLLFALPSEFPPIWVHHSLPFCSRRWGAVSSGNVLLKWKYRQTTVCKCQHNKRLPVFLRRATRSLAHTNEKTAWMPARSVRCVHVMIWAEVQKIDRSPNKTERFWQSKYLSVDSKPPTLFLFDNVGRFQFCHETRLHSTLVRF